MLHAIRGQSHQQSGQNWSHPICTVNTLSTLCGRTLYNCILGDWLHTTINVPHRELNGHMVTNPSTKQALRKLTSLIKTNTLLSRYCYARPLIHRAVRSDSRLIIVASSQSIM